MPSLLQSHLKRFLSMGTSSLQRTFSRNNSSSTSTNASNNVAFRPSPAHNNNSSSNTNGTASSIRRGRKVTGSQQNGIGECNQINQ